MKATKPPAGQSEVLHRIRDVRLAEGVSLEAVARRMNERPSLLKKEECADADLRLTDLYRWQSALNVPLIDLLAEPEYALSENIHKRASLTRVAKTAKSILRQSTAPDVQRLAQTLVDQLVDVMPELEEIGAWHERGVPKSTKEMGRIAEFIVDSEWWAVEEDFQV